jgi:predicted dehydrogenase
MIVPRHVLGGVGYQAPSDTVNIAVVGCGAQGAADATELVTGGQNIVALADVDFGFVDRAVARRTVGRDGQPNQNGIKLQEAYQKAKRYADFRKMLEAQKDIDGIVVATPDHTHAVIAKAAMELGKHVYVEKPLAITLADAVAVCQASERAGKIVRVGFNRRFSPWLDPLHEALALAGRRIAMIRVNVGGVDDDWSNTPGEGGRLMGEGVHFLDLANWLLGSRPAGVSASFLGAPDMVNPNATIHVSYPDGSAASIAYTTVGAPSMGKERIEVFGNGRAAFSDDYRVIQTFGMDAPGGSRVRGDKGHLGALAEFASAVRGQSSLVRAADARDGLLATWMVLAVYESATTGRFVSLADAEPF